MTDKPILFSGPMIRALLDGRKTQTRRILNLADDLTDKRFTGELVNYYGDRRLGMAFEGTTRVHPIHYFPGIRLWVREAFTLEPAVRRPKQIDNVIYRADVPDREPLLGDVLTKERADWVHAQGLKWKPSIHMPRWASRLTLTVTDVRVQRVQEISYFDTCAEGVDCDTCAAMGQSACYRKGCGASREAFRTLWDSLNADRGFGWDDNPWVVALTFTVHHCNIDQMEAA